MLVAKGKYEYWLTKDGLILLEGWARDGLTDEQISYNMGINKATLYRYKKDHCDICDALKKGKEVVDRKVENALLKRALGFEYEEVTKERLIDTRQSQRHGGESELTEDQWELAKAYFSDTCAYCGKNGILTKDHIDPLANGGRLIIQNVVPACRSCNSSKKDHQWLSWFQKQSFYNKDRARKISDYVSFVLNYSPAQRYSDLVVTKVVTKMVVPDTTAEIFWLKNRMPDKWRNDPHKTNLDLEEQQARIDKMKLEMVKLNDNPENYEDDGFIEALKSDISEVWADDSDD